MAKIGKPLDTGEKFPKMTFQLTDGNVLKLPDDMGEGYSVVLLYRGEW